MSIIFIPLFLLYSFITLSIFAFLLFKKKVKTAFGTLLVLCLIPTWDVVIALMIYIPASHNWSGDTIKHQVTTDSIYYDSYYGKYGPTKYYWEKFFYSKNKYAEMEVSEIRDFSIVKEEGFYRFWIDKKNKLQFKKIDKIESQYTVKYQRKEKNPIIPVSFHSVQIIDRKTNEIIAQGNSAYVHYDNVGIFPFFNFVHWKESPAFIASNPNFTKIEYKTINP